GIGDVGRGGGEGAGGGDALADDEAALGRGAEGGVDIDAEVGGLGGLIFVVDGALEGAEVEAGEGQAVGDGGAGDVGGQPIAHARQDRQLQPADLGGA